MAVVVAAMAWAVCALWLYGRDQFDYEASRAGRSDAVELQRSAVAETLAKITRRHAENLAALETQRQRVIQAEKALKTLHDLDPGTVDRWFGDAEQQKIHEAQITHVEALKTGAAAKVAELERTVADDLRAKDEAARKLAEEEATYRELRDDRGAASHYFRLAWQRTHRWIFAVFFLYLFGGLLAAIALYYGWSGWVARGRPVRLVAADAPLPVIGESAVVVEDTLWPGEVLRVRRRFLQTADDGLSRRNRLLLNWRAPLSCLAGGLTQLIELRNGRSEGERRVVFTCADDPFAELAIVAVPEGGSFVLRAGFLRGMILRAGQPPAIRRHWRLFAWQSWVSGQFGYFEFTGPCRLLVSCVSALHGVSLPVREDGKPSTRRTAQAGLVGFTPRLELSPVRSEGFWRYCRGRAPLFDLHASGNGMLLTRECEGRGRDGFRARVLKRCGL